MPGIRNREEEGSFIITFVGVYCILRIIQISGIKVTVISFYDQMQFLAQSLQSPNIYYVIGFMC